MSESRFYHITSKRGMQRLPTLEETIKAMQAEGFIWLHYCQPCRDELSALIEPLGVHPLSVEDCFDENQIPKIEDFPRNTFILFNSFSYSERSLSIAEIDLFIGENFLVTVTHSDSADWQSFNDIERTVATDMESARQGPPFLLHVILDHFVDHKFIAIEALEDDLDAAEEAIMVKPSGFDPARLLDLRRSLLNLRKSLFHEREILVKICRRDCPFIPEKAVVHYRDIYDHLAKFFELTEAYRDIVTSLMEIYLSLLNNQMARAANETNATVRRLTLITTIFMPLTLLAGIGGMSEWSMMTGPENWKIAYPVFLVAMVVIGLVNYYLLKRVERQGSSGDAPE